jgi:hypothetical protein
MTRKRRFKSGPRYRTHGEVRMEEQRRSTDPVVDSKGRTHGGYAGVAEVLNTLFPYRRRPISRQLVQKWWEYREVNEFPAAAATSGNFNRGRGRPEFDYAAVVKWYRSKRQHRDEVRYRRSRTEVITPTQATSTGTGETSLAA